MTTVFHARLYGRFIEIQSNFRRTKLHGTNQCANLPQGSFSNGENIRAPIQFRRQRQPQPVKRSFFFKRSIDFHMNSTSGFRVVKRNELSFFGINKPFPAPLHSVSQIRFSSVAIFSCFHRSEAWSQLEYRVVSSAQIAILKILLSGRSLMYSRKR